MRTRAIVTGFRARLLRRKDGAATVEFALVLPIILSAFFVVIEGGRLAYTQAALYFAAQEATRFAVVNEGEVTNEQIKDFAAGKLIGLRGSLAVITVVEDPEPTLQTSTYTVNLTYQFTPLIPYLPNDTIELAASSSGFLAFASTQTASP